MNWFVHQNFIFEFFHSSGWYEDNHLIQKHEQMIKSTSRKIRQGKMTCKLYLNIHWVFFSFLYIYWDIKWKLGGGSDASDQDKCKFTNISSDDDNLRKFSDFTKINQISLKFCLSNINQKKVPHNDKYPRNLTYIQWVFAR